MTLHRLAATPETVRFGIFDGSFPPVLTIASGDEVIIECVSGGPEVMPVPSSGFGISAALAAIHEAKLPRIGPHILTGPVAIDGAEPGDLLEVRIRGIDFGEDWGYCAIRPLAGTLPEDFSNRFLTHVPIDRIRRVCKLPWGPEIPLAPFFGTMGVAPPLRYGALSSREPREHAGNIDNKELGAGSTLFLPVWEPGAKFSVGDGHGVQGDGEVCTNALEMALTGRFEFVLHKQASAARPLPRFPRGETPTHFISIGLNEDLDQAMKQALREMIAMICERTDFTREQAYQFCSLAVDFHVTQTVNGEKGIHGMLRKTLLQ